MPAGATAAMCPERKGEEPRRSPAPSWGNHSGEPETHVQFEAGPTAYRWVFCREGEDVRSRVLELRDDSDHDNRVNRAALDLTPSGAVTVAGRQAAAA
ncbi:hypothetical protein ACFXKH_37280 [Streptomyces caelestis]|uniref:hypothetical protein n=1 Tax=Streptomyces caelestis TaxID=36816 RepID=UPI0036A329F3